MITSILTTILAQAPTIKTDPKGTDVATLEGLESIFASIVRAILGLSAIVLFIMLIVGGFNYITSGGDPQKAGAARQTLTYAIMGAILIASALLIIRLIEAITGANLSVFKVYIP